MGHPERRKELERQKALIEQHLAWLNREIESEKAPAEDSGRPQPEEAPDLAIDSPPASPVTKSVTEFFGLDTGPLPAATGESFVGDLPEEVKSARRNAREIQQEVRGGCFFYAMLLVLVSVLFYIFLHFTFVTREPDPESEREDNSPTFPQANEQVH